MKIAFVVPAFELGGVETFLLRLAGFFRERGHSVSLIATESRGSWFEKWCNDFSPGEVIAPRPFRSLRAHAKHVGRRLASGKYDVVLINHARFAQSALACLPDSCAAIPVVHNDANAIYRVACSNADCWNVAVAVSAKVEDETRKRVPNKPVVLIPSGVPIPSARTAEQAYRGGTLRLVYIGRLNHKQKGVLHLPEIVGRLRHRRIDCKLSIVGAGTDEGTLRGNIERAGLAGTIEVCGALPLEKVQSLLNESHILLLPSYHEGLPIVLLEAMAAGCAPVASRLSGITDFAVTHGSNGLLAETGNIDDFAEHIASLAQNPGRWQSLSNSAAAEARRRFSTEAMGTAYLDLFERTLAGSYPLAKSRRKSSQVCSRMFAKRDRLPLVMSHWLDNTFAQLSLRRAVAKTP